MKIGIKSARNPPRLSQRLVTLRDDCNLRRMRFGLRLALDAHGFARDGSFGKRVGL
jgi:hypothetical protein